MGQERFYYLSFLRCAKFLGEKHQHLASSLVPELLSNHPFFATPEPSIDDPAYVAILILVFNATAKSPTMLPMFPDHTARHYGYLRDSQPQLVPHLDIEVGDLNLERKKTEGVGEQMFNCKYFKRSATNLTLQLALGSDVDSVWWSLCITKPQ